MAIIRSSQLTQAEAVIFNATIMQGLHDAVNKQTDLVADKISLTRPVAFEGGVNDPLSKRIPSKIVFPFSAGTPLVVEDLTSKDRPFSNFVEGSVQIDIKPYGAGYYIKRTDFFNDLYYTLTQIPKKLVRAIIKLPDVHLARLLRSGCEDKDYTGNPYFAADKFGKRGNLHKKVPLNRKNLIAGCVDMLSRRTAENGDCEVPPDTLVIPPTLFDVASKAVGTRKTVDSSGVTTINRKKRDKSNPLSIIKQIVVMPELLQGGNPTDQTTWYLASCMGTHGACGLLVAVDPGFEYLTNVTPSDPEVFYRNRFAFGAERYGGFAYGNALFMTRFEAEDSVPTVTEAPVPTQSEPKIRFADEKVSEKTHDAKLTELAADIAKHLGCKAEDILQYVDRASRLPGSDGHPALQGAAEGPAPAASETTPPKKSTKTKLPSVKAAKKP